MSLYFFASVRTSSRSQSSHVPERRKNIITARKLNCKLNYSCLSVHGGMKSLPLWSHVPSRESVWYYFLSGTMFFLGDLVPERGSIPREGQGRLVPYDRPQLPPTTKQGVRILLDCFLAFFSIKKLVHTTLRCLWIFLKKYPQLDSATGNTRSLHVT